MYRFSMQVFALFVSLLFHLPKQLDAQCEHNSSTSKLSGELYLQRIIYAGSPFFLDNWFKGDVFLESGEVVKDQLLRYNALEDELIWKEPVSSRLIKLDKMLISAFTIKQNNIFYFERISSITKGTFTVSNEFLQILHKGKYTLYACRWVEKTAQMESIYIGGRGQNALLIKPKTTYYIKFLDGSVSSIALGLNSFVNFFSSEIEISRKLLRNQGLNIKNEAQLIDAVKWAETLSK